MAYIVESSLDIGGKIIPWSNKEQERLIKDKEEKLQKMAEEKKPKPEVKVEKKEEKSFTPFKEEKRDFKKNKKK